MEGEGKEREGLEGGRVAKEGKESRGVMENGGGMGRKGKRGVRDMGKRRGKGRTGGALQQIKIYDYTPSQSTQGRTEN